MERTARLAVIAAFAGSVALSAAMTATRRDHGLGLGQAWSWILTALQVSALYLLGRGQGVGWLLGAGIQLCWITYAVLTSQYGFVPGCLISAAVHSWSYLRTVRPSPPRVGEVPTENLSGDGPVRERGG